MGKLQEFDITLDNNKTAYIPGESISGTLKISLAQSIQCKAIKVSCQGVCGVTSKAHDTDWMEEEQYFSSSISIADKGTLKEGEHSFPFKFLLPVTAPTSFEGPYGKIMYRVRSFIDTPRFTKDYKVEEPFSMSNNVNLNEVPHIHEPSSSSVTKNFTYMLVKNGTVVLKAKSDLRGYIEGQIIKVSAEIENRSDKSTGYVVASLMQKVTYNTKKPTIDLRAVAEVEGPGVKGGHKGEWKEQIIVPSLPLSSLTGGNLIEINYYIQVYLKYPEVSLILPIYIGSVAVDPTRACPSRPVPPTPVPRSGSNPTPAPAPSPAASTTDSVPPSLPPHTNPKPKPRPRSSYVPPSAPPTELYPQLPNTTEYNTEIPKSPESGHQTAVSPNAFSYAPGLSFRQGQNSHNTSQNRERSRTLSASCSMIHPPDYRTSLYPHEPPPSYDDSFNT